MSHDWFSAENAADSFFPQGMSPLWALFQAGFVFQNIDYKLFLLSSTDSSLFLFRCLHQPPLAMVLSSPQLEHWSRTSVSLCGLDAAHLHPPLCFFPCFLFTLISFPRSDQSAAVGSPRGWEIPTSSHGMTMHHHRPELQLSAHRANQDHLVTKLGPAGPRTLKLFSLLQRKRGRR